MLTYYFIFFAIIETVIASSLHVKGKRPLAAKVDAVAIIVYPILMIGATITLLTQ